MRPLVRLCTLALSAMSFGCDETVDESSSGLTGELYNPCGADVAAEDCPGGKPIDGTTTGTGVFRGITGSRGAHTLAVYTLDCLVELDSIGTAVDTNLCPDCSLVLEMEHVNVDDGCGVGAFTYKSLVGLRPRGGGEYAVYLSLDGLDWYAFGDGTVEDQELSYSAIAVYDEVYGSYYAAEPAYGFAGDHLLVTD